MCKVLDFLPATATEKFSTKTHNFRSLFKNFQSDPEQPAYGQLRNCPARHRSEASTSTCTISSFQRVSIGRECILADRVMLIDFDHGVVETERPIRDQGIYKRDVHVGHNVWVGYGTSFLRGTHVGDNCVIGTLSVVTKDVPANAVAAGAPVRVLRHRDAPKTMRWE